MSRNEKFNALVSTEKTTTVARNKIRIKNRARLRESQAIALKVLDKLDDLGWTQKKLAEELNVSPQQVNKIVRGKENMTLDTQIKLQEVLDIPILASYYEDLKFRQRQYLCSEEKNLAFCTWGASSIVFSTENLIGSQKVALTQITRSSQKTFIDQYSIAS